MSNCLEFLQRVGVDANRCYEEQWIWSQIFLKSELLSKQFTSDDRYPVRVFPTLGVLSKELVVKLTWIWVVTRWSVPSIETLC